MKILFYLNNNNSLKLKSLGGIETLNLSLFKKIKTNTLNNIINDEKLNNKIIDFVSIDVEGNELNVLKNSGDWYFIVLQIPKETRIKRIKELYPDNFEDHIRNMNDISEKGLVNFPKDKTLYIYEDTKENIEKSIKDFIS